MKIPIHHLLTVMLAVMLAAAVSGVFFDISYDGQAYHQDAVLRLVEGWNPLSEVVPESELYHVWVNHYPKGAWYLAAAIVKATGRVELGKAPNLLLIFASFGLAYQALKEWTALSNPLVIWLSALAAFNPVSVYQSLSFYVDGQLSSTLVFMIASGALVLKRPDKRRLLLLGLCILYALNLKFTAIMYVAVFCLVYLGWIAARRETDVFRRALLTIAAAAFMGMALIGFNPYVTNTLRDGHPLYPVFGAQDKDVIAYQRPANFEDKNAPERLVASVFSRSSNAIAPGVSEPKCPLECPRRRSRCSATRMCAWRAGGRCSAESCC
jgi:hypothetical protein